MSNQSVTARTQKHFNDVALKLDWWARRNRYYYQDLDRLHQFLIPVGSKVLEIGCGTGDLLANIEPGLGVGIDFSTAVINLAQTKYPSLKFYCLDVEYLDRDLPLKNSLRDAEFDYIILSRKILGGI